MFGLLRKKVTNSVSLHSICEGKVISITEVPDKMFADKMLGDGIAFVFEGDTIYAPCDGEVIMLAETKHAIGFKTENGAEILIHVGLDTVNLNGEGLYPQIEVGSSFKRGQPLLKINKVFMISKSIDLTTPMIVTNGNEFELQIEEKLDKKNRGELVLIITNK